QLADPALEQQLDALVPEPSVDDFGIVQRRERPHAGDTTLEHDSDQDVADLELPASDHAVLRFVATLERGHEMPTSLRSLLTPPTGASPCGNGSRLATAASVTVPARAGNVPAFVAFEAPFFG